jgi:ribosomal protein S18 acetylase RimI-like enzyme
MLIQPTPPERFAALAETIAAQNSQPETQCIHSGDMAEAIAAEMHHLHDEGRFVMLQAEQQDELAGLLGGELDDEMAFLWGPFVLTEDWDGVTAALWQQWQSSLPPAITKQAAFLHLKNERGRAFYQAQGFVEKQIAHIYVAPRPEHILPPSARVRLFEERDAAAFTRLHEIIFAGTFETADKAIAAINDERRIFVYPEGDTILGYCYAASDSQDEGYIEFIGVDQAARGQGVGKQLLLTALHWLFADRNMPQVGLTVLDFRTNAQKLYEAVGFELLYTGVSLEKR